MLWHCEFLRLYCISFYLSQFELDQKLNVSGKLFSAATKYSKKLGSKLAELFLEDYKIGCDNQILPCDAPLDFPGQFM